MENRIWYEVKNIFGAFVEAVVAIVVLLFSAVITIGTLFFVLVICNPIAWMGMVIIAMVFKILQG